LALVVEAYEDYTAGPKFSEKVGLGAKPPVSLGTALSLSPPTTQSVEIPTLSGSLSLPSRVRIVFADTLPLKAVATPTLSLSRNRAGPSSLA
jgi:hypothetical protein